MKEFSEFSEKYKDMMNKPHVGHKTKKTCKGVNKPHVEHKTKKICSIECKKECLP